MLFRGPDQKEKLVAKRSYGRDGVVERPGSRKYFLCASLGSIRPPQLVFFVRMVADHKVKLASGGRKHRDLGVRRALHGVHDDLGAGIRAVGFPKSFVVLRIRANKVQRAPNRHVVVGTVRYASQQCRRQQPPTLQNLGAKPRPRTPNS